MTLPEAGNLGGGGFIVAYLADRSEVVTVDFREIAPRTATPTMYLGADGKPRPRYRAGAWAAGVPGTVRGLGLAHARFGKTAWAELVRPAARLAREAFRSRPSWPRSLNRQLSGARAEDQLEHPATTSADWAISPSRSPRSASPIERPGMPATGSFSAISPIAWTGSPAKGADEFYTGRDRRADRRATWTKNGGFVSLEDLKVTRPSCGRRSTPRSAAPKSTASGPHLPAGSCSARCSTSSSATTCKDGRESPATLHRVTEAMRRAFFTRADKLGDPDFVEIPTRELMTSKALRRRARRVDRRAARHPAENSHPFRS